MKFNAKMLSQPRFPLRQFSLLFLLCLLPALLAAIKPVSRTIERSYAGVGDVDYSQRTGPITILPSPDGKVSLEITISVEAADPDEGKRFLDRVTLAEQVTPASLTLALKLDEIKSWTQNNSNSKVVFKDGTKFRNVRNFTANTVLYLPQADRLKLSARFDKVTVDPGVSINNLDLVLNNVDFRSGKITGDVDINLRFGSAEIANVGGDIKGILNNARLETDGARNVDLNSRFSGIELGEINDLVIQSNNDEVTIERGGRMEISERFSTYRLGNTQAADITTNNGKFTVESGTDYAVNGRFARFKIQTLETLRLTSNNNCEYQLGQLGTTKGNGRFTNLYVDKFSGEADLTLYNGKFRVDELDASFTGVDVKGSFFEVDLEVAANANYHVEAKLEFGRLHTPKSLITTLSKEENRHLEKHLKTVGATASSPVIRISGNQGKLYLD